MYDARCVMLFRVGGSFGHQQKMYGDESGYQSDIEN
jgi:hypothetical protein